jgi:outer membrane protein assembly factor BamB
VGIKTKNHSVNHASPVIAVDRTIYFASGDGTVYALYPNGKLRWAFEAAGGPFTATPVVAKDGTIYIAGYGGTIVAFSGGHGSLQNSAWPKFQAGPANSGRGR